MLYFQEVKRDWKRRGLGSNVSHWRENGEEEYGFSFGDGRRGGRRGP